MWDNMIGYNDGLAQLLDDTQRMAERKAAGHRPGPRSWFLLPISILRRAGFGDERHRRSDLGRRTARTLLGVWGR